MSTITTHSHYHYYLSKNKSTLEIFVVTNALSLIKIDKYYSIVIKYFFNFLYNSIIHINKLLTSRNKENQKLYFYKYKNHEIINKC